MGFDLESVAEATSGAIGALVSTTILYPLDTCKTKYQAEVRAQNQLKYRFAGTFLMFSGKQFLSVRCFHYTSALGQRTCSPLFHSSSTSMDTVCFFKRLYLEKSGNKTMGTKANLIVAAAAGACTVIVTMPLDTESSRMLKSEFGKSKGLWKTLSKGTWIEAFDGLGISLLLTSNPSIT